MSKYDNVTTENELFEMWKQKKPEKIEYGIIYNSYFITEDRPVKILGIYDLDMVLQKEGNELQQCKNVIWNNLLSIVKSIQS